jgi:hypothetical protein
MKITEKNISLVFLGGTMLIGILIIGVLVYFENNDVESVEIVDKQANTNFKTIESKIKSLKTQNFDPNSYNTIATDINSSYDQELLTADQKTNLMLNLSTIYSDLVYARCEFYLTGMGLDSSSQVSSWLSQLENITSRNAKIVKYRNQIKWYDHYSTTLPIQVNKFIGGGTTSFEENKYIKFKEDLEKMPNLEPKYKNKRKFILIKTQLTTRLNNLYNQWNQQEIGI